MNPITKPLIIPIAISALIAVGLGASSNFPSTPTQPPARDITLESGTLYRQAVDSEGGAYGTDITRELVRRAEAEAAAKAEAERLAAEEAERQAAEAARAAEEAEAQAQAYAARAASVRAEAGSMTDDEMIDAIASLESGIYGRNSGNGYFGFTQINAGWLAAHGYPYGDGSGGVGDSTNPNPAMERAAMYEYCYDHHGSVAQAYYARFCLGMY